MHFPELFEAMLKERGIRPEEKEFFLNPDYGRLYDPLLLPDMARARDRVIRAMKDGEHIVVFSDYDADGIPGAVVLSDFFNRAGYKNISFYIPHRHDEGFGLNLEAIGECASRGAKLIITVDCGTADSEEIALANKNGLDVIITDHHEPQKRLPEAFAIINPKIADSKYPFRDICGSAVVFKLVQAILAEQSFGIKKGMEKWSLDMVGIATLSDCVPLVGENRIFARFGLEVLKKSRRPGLSALFRNLNLDQKNLTEDDVAFMITPRINAASRMGVPMDAFLLLSTADINEAERLANHLEKVNQERKGVVASMVKEAKSHLKKREKIGEVMVVGNPKWKPSLVGLVCNSLVEEYERPVFVWGRDGAGRHPSGQMVLKGSCRSYNGYNLFKLMEKVSGSFIEFGGHKGAGGFSVTLESLSTLEEKLSQALLMTPPSPPLSRGGELPVSISDIGENLWQTVSLFAPFGEGNEKPVFKIVNASIKTIRQFGKANEHLELALESGVRAIAFFTSPSTYNLAPSALSCTLHAHLEKSYFRNRPELRLRIIDLQP
ncbi:MAG: single-stranded-DNA-specific exonuclease RecJ [Patescibacteria group bacterium]